MVCLGKNVCQDCLDCACFCRYNTKLNMGRAAQFDHWKMFGMVPRRTWGIMVSFVANGNGIWFFTISKTDTNWMEVLRTNKFCWRGLNHDNHSNGCMSNLDSWFGCCCVQSTCWKQPKKLHRQEAPNSVWGQEANVPNTSKSYGTITNDVKHDRNCSSTNFYIELHKTK